MNNNDLIKLSKKMKLINPSRTHFCSIGDYGRLRVFDGLSRISVPGNVWLSVVGDGI